MHNPATRYRALRLNFRTMIILLAALPTLAEASIFHGETLDMVADIASWVVLIIAPTIAIGLFWIVHILPEKIAEKRRHPQAKAIQTLCVLSLFFGGLLWPLAWLWAYSKPVFYKMAYGTDTVEPEHGANQISQEEPDSAAEIQQLRQRLSELEAQQAERAQLAAMASAGQQEA